MNSAHARTVVIAVLMLTALPQAYGQLRRANDRTWHALRGGLVLGYARSLHSGDVPMLPTDGNTMFTDGGGSNVTFGVLLEKPLSRFIALGAAISLDPLSATFTKRFQEPFRIADSQGTLYDVRREHETEYSLQYVSLRAFAKLYPSGGPGFFVGGSFGLAALAKGTYKNSAMLVEPIWAKGSQSATTSGDLPSANELRYTVGALVGYEIFFNYGFVAPQLQYDFALNAVSSAGWSDNWSVDNLRAVVTVTFPFPF